MTDLNDRSGSLDIAERFYGAQGRDYPQPEPAPAPAWRKLAVAAALAIIGGAIFCAIGNAITQ